MSPKSFACILGTSAAAALAHPTYALQTAGWPGPTHIERQTDNGCLVAFIDPAGMRPINPIESGDWPIRSISWSGECAAGRPIDGSGVLKVSTVNGEGITVTTTSTGTLVNGYWNGEVAVQISVGEMSQAFDPVIMDMGCIVGGLGLAGGPPCTPGQPAH